MKLTLQNAAIMHCCTEILDISLSDLSGRRRSFSFRSRSSAAYSLDRRKAALSDIPDVFIVMRLARRLRGEKDWKLGIASSKRTRIRQTT